MAHRTYDGHKLVTPNYGGGRGGVRDTLQGLHVSGDFIASSVTLPTGRKFQARRQEPVKHRRVHSELRQIRSLRNQPCSGAQLGAAELPPYFPEGPDT